MRCGDRLPNTSRFCRICNPSGQKCGKVLQITPPPFQYIHPGFQGPLCLAHALIPSPPPPSSYSSKHPPEPREEHHRRESRHPVQPQGPDRDGPTMASRKCPSNCFSLCPAQFPACPPGAASFRLVRHVFLDAHTFFSCRTLTPTQCAHHQRRELDV